MQGQHVIGTSITWEREIRLDAIRRGQRTCPMVDEQPDDLEVAIIAGGPERRRVGACGAVDSRPVAQQQVHQREVAGGCGAPQGRGTLNGLPVKDNWNQGT